MSKRDIVVAGQEVREPRKIQPKAPSKPVAVPAEPRPAEPQEDEFEAFRAQTLDPYEGLTDQAREHARFDARVDELADEGNRFWEILQEEQVKAKPRPKEAGMKQVEHDLGRAATVFKRWLFD